MVTGKAPIASDEENVLQEKEKKDEDGNMCAILVLARIVLRMKL